MKFLLVAVNAKYIHSNLGVYSLKAYADKVQEEMREKEGFLPSHVVEIEIGEYTINQKTEQILKDIYERQPDAVGFSCYIWNIAFIRELVRDLHQVMPRTRIWMGGPEVSYCALDIMKEEPAVTGILTGEGEETFAELIRTYAEEPLPEGENRNSAVSEKWREIRGLVFCNGEGEIVENPPRPVMDMSRIPFPYDKLEDFDHKIIYYESSRGCPYACSYCLSSVDKSVRFRDLELVKKELDFFLEKRVAQVKFVDRTFNCKKSHAVAIWRHLLEHDNGVTNFHFEISADLLGEEELELIRQMRPGLIQLEIGVQTTNPNTIAEIRRTMDLDKLAAVVKKINSFGNVHQHLDLIAGLPQEDYRSFVKSFNDVYKMKPEQLQLGFLKVLQGSYMAEKKESYGLVCKSSPPYEVLFTRWLSYEEILKLKAVEEMVEIYYNSGQFQHTILLLEREFESPYEMFAALAEAFGEEGLEGVSHSRLAHYEFLYRLIQRYGNYPIEEYRDRLMYDLYLRENVKSRPSFASDQSAYKTRIRDFFISEKAHPRYLSGYETYDSRQMSRMAHIERMSDGSYILFDYQNREALRHNARTVRLNLK